MKKLIALLLAALMMLAGATAFAAQGDALLGHGEDGDDVYFRYIFADGDTLYLASYDSLYTYRVGDADMARYDYPTSGGDEAENIIVQRYPFAYNGQLYAIELFTAYEEYSDFIKAEITPYALADGVASESGASVPIDWTGLLQYYDTDCYPIEPEYILQVGGKLFFRYWSDQGDRLWAAIDLETMKVDTGLSDFTDVSSAISYRDGALLLQVYNSERDSTHVRFQVYDPRDESVQPLSEVEVPSYSPYVGLAYDPDADQVYCLKGGEICTLDVMTGEVGESVTDMPMETYNGSDGLVFNGYYVFASNGAAVRNLDPDQKASARLKIFDGSWTDSINDAYYQFANAHGDVSVVLSRDEADGNNIIESMMNRDSGVDIYVLSTNTSNYEAVHNRGYMMELDGSAKAVAFADSIYPRLREALSYDGHLVGLPVEAYCWTMGADEKALQRIGLTIEDVPTNWSDFLDFLNALPQYIPDDSGITPFYPDNTIENIRSQLFYQIFNDYQNYVNATDPAMGYNTELLRGLLRKLESVDFEALGYAHEEDDGSRSRGYGVVMGGESENKILFETSIGCTFGNFYSEHTPMLMSMDAQTPAYMMLQTMVAFVNPFTKAPEQALAFMDQLADSLSDGVRYSFQPDLNTPIRGEYNEKYLNEIREELDNLNRQLETASAQDKQSIEETIREWEQNQEYMERMGWEISQWQIDWYRANDDNILLMPANWLYSENAGEGWDLMMQYTEGGITAEELLTSIDKKVQMMLLEGN